MKLRDLELLWCLWEQGFYKEYGDFMQVLVLEDFTQMLEGQKWLVYKKRK